MTPRLFTPPLLQRTGRLLRSRRSAPSTCMTTFQDRSVVWNLFRPLPTAKFQQLFAASLVTPILAVLLSLSMLSPACFLPPVGPVQWTQPTSQVSGRTPTTLIVISHQHKVHDIATCRELPDTDVAFTHNSALSRI